MNSGHGWVRPLPSGIKARCGGPGICGECAIELSGLTKAVKELYFWRVRGSMATNFTAILYTLMQKGSGGNRERLGIGFAWELEAYRQWAAAEDETSFFLQFGFNLFKRPEE